MQDANDIHSAAPPVGPSARFDVLTVASTIVLALSLVTPLINLHVGAAAGLVLLGQGLYAIYHRR